MKVAILLGILAQDIVLLTEVAEVDDGLGGEKLVGVNDVDFGSVPANSTDVMAFLHHSQNTLENHEFLLLFLAAKTTFNRTSHTVDLVLDLHVREKKRERDNEGE